MNWPPPLPKEHGSWAMLVVPLLTGLAVAPGWRWRALALLAAALGFFLLRFPLATLVKTRARKNAARAEQLRWAAVCGGVTAISGGWLVVGQKLWGLAAMGAAGVLLVIFHLWLVARRREMSVAGQLAGIAGLALGAPMACYTAAGVLNGTAALLWLANTLYFGGTVFYIKLKVRQQPRLPAPERPVRRLLKARACLAYQTFALTVIILLVTLQKAPLLIPLAFAPATVKVLHGAWRWQDKKTLNLVRLGVTEIVHSVTFAALVIGSFK
ncbi:MAG: YwiC-like family protein [Anaerolineae bacterium]